MYIDVERYTSFRKMYTGYRKVSIGMHVYIVMKDVCRYLNLTII